MKTKKSTKPHKKGAKKRKAGLKGAAKLKAATKGLTEQIAKPSGVLVGLVVSSVANNLLEKVPFLQGLGEGETPAADGEKFNAKKLIKPLILAVVGAGTVALTHKKAGAAMQFANGLGYGIIGGGALSAVKAVTGKSLVSGLGDAGVELEKKALEANYYKHQALDMAKMIAEKQFTPELPENVEGVKGLSKDWGSELETEKSGTIL